MTLAKQLVAWRERLGLSQEQAAKSLGVSLRTYENWEQDRRVPRGFALNALRQKIAPAQVARKSKKK